MLLDTPWPVFSSPASPALPLVSQAVRDACLSLLVATFFFLAGAIAIEVEEELDCANCGIAAEEPRCTDQQRQDMNSIAGCRWFCRTASLWDVLGLFVETGIATGVTAIEAEGEAGKPSVPKTLVALPPTSLSEPSYRCRR